MADGAKARAIVTVTHADGELEIRDAIRELIVDDHDRLVDEVRVTVDDAFGLASYGIVSGDKVVVKLGFDEDFTKVFEGEVQKVTGAMGGDAESSPTVIVAHDPSVVLCKKEDTVEAQENDTLSVFVSRIAREAGLTAQKVSCDPDPTFTAPNLPRSLGQNHFQFLQSLALKWGCRCFVEVIDDRPQFCFISVEQLLRAEPMGSMQLCHSWGDIREFKYERVAALAARRLVSASVDPVSGETVVADSGPVAPQTAAIAGVTASLASAEPGIAARADALAPSRTGTASPAESPVTAQPGTSDATAVEAEVVNDPTRVSGLLGEVRAAGHVAIRAKGRVVLTGISPWAEGDWWVRRVQHVYTQQKQQRDALASTYECELEVTR